MFAYKYWENFCRELDKQNIHSVTAESVLAESRKEFLILKHDVEDKPEKALDMAKIEARYGHRGTYYVQGFLLNEKNIPVLKEIQELGHELSYHHDVMDANAGDIQKALETFRQNKDNFEKNGFIIKTVCQHGNPIANRVGYTSNRDFFRNEGVCAQFPDIAEIMVNFKEKTGVNHTYISDAGYGFKTIFDPETNDIVKSDHRDVKLKNLDSVADVIKRNGATIVSTHPHRWCESTKKAYLRYARFKFLRAGARVAYKIPGINKIMEKFYFITKKI